MMQSVGVGGKRVWEKSVGAEFGSAHLDDSSRAGFFQSGELGHLMTGQPVSPSLLSPHSKH